MNLRTSKMTGQHLDFFHVLCFVSFVFWLGTVLFFAVVTVVPGDLFLFIDKYNRGVITRSLDSEPHD